MPGDIMADGKTRRNEHLRPDINYFVLPHRGLMLLVLFGLYNMLAATFAPSLVPSFLGPIASMVRYMGENHPYVCRAITVACVLCHLYEARIARVHCRKLRLSESATIKWTLSTFVFGYPSLMNIQALRNEMKR